MKSSADIPVTTAIRALRAAKVQFTPRHYPYVEHGGTRQVATSLGVDEHAVIKTLVMEGRDSAGAAQAQPLLVLMHGDREVSTKQLARLLGVKTITPATEATVKKVTGYVPGGVSPFGTRAHLPVFVEESILALSSILINGGKRGFIVQIDPSVLTTVLRARPIRVGIEER